MGDIKYILEDSSKVFRGGVKNNSVRQTDKFFGYVLGCVMMFIPLFATVYIKANVVSSGYKISKLVHQLESLRDKESKAESELMLLENPARLYNIAKSMGFDYPTVEKASGD